MKAVYASFFLGLPTMRFALVKEPTNQSNILTREDMLNWLDGRFNYASISCAARVLASNKGSKSSSSILHHQKDSYMLNLCCLPEKYVVIELCQDIRIDTLVLANLEFFSSTFKDFSLFVAKRLPAVLGPATLASGSAWRHVADFTAENSRREQIFQVFGMNSYARYLKIEFRSHYGNEYYCPVTFLKVYGKTMMEDYEESALVGPAVPPPAIPMGNPPPATEEVAASTTTTMEYEGGAVTVTTEAPQSTSTAEFNDFEYAINDLMELFRKSSMNALNKQKCEVPSSSEAPIPTSTPIDPSATLDYDFQENIFKTIHKRLQQLESIVKNSSHSLEADVKRLAAEMSHVKEEISLEAAPNNSIVENDSNKSYRLRLIRHLENRNEELLKVLSEKISQESKKVDASNRTALYLSLFAGLQLLSTLLLIYYSFGGRGTKPSATTTDKILPTISKEETTIHKSLSKEEQVVPHTIRYQSSSPTSSDLLRSAKDPLLLGESEADIIDATFERSPDYQLDHHHDHTPLRQSLDSTDIKQTDADESMDLQETQALLDS